jgi:hypothetical protein
MKKFIEDEINEEEPNDTRYSLDFNKKEKDNNSIILPSQSSVKENRPLSAKPLLFRRFIPKLKPVKSHLKPSYMNLGGSSENFNAKKYKENLIKNKVNINIVAEEDYEKTANSGDERYSYNNLNSNKIVPFSSSDDNDAIESDTINININNSNNIINKINDDTNIKLKKAKNKRSNNISHIRKIVIRMKEKNPNKKYSDDTDIIVNTPYDDYIKQNYCFNWEEPYLDYDFDFVKKKKSKSIYVGNNKNHNRPPILGFLQMNENSANTTLSSAFSEI